MAMRDVVVAAMMPCVPAKGGGGGAVVRRVVCSVLVVLCFEFELARDYVAQVLTPLAHPEHGFFSLSQITLLQKNKHFLHPQQHVTST
jgi:hypothetical protein